MLSGGVFASMAMSEAVFSQFLNYTAASGNQVFNKQRPWPGLLILPSCTQYSAMVGGTIPATLKMAGGCARTGEVPCVVQHSGV